MLRLKILGKRVVNDQTTMAGQAAHDYRKPPLRPPPPIKTSPPNHRHDSSLLPSATPAFSLLSRALVGEVKCRPPPEGGVKRQVSLPFAFLVQGQHRHRLHCHLHPRSVLRARLDVTHALERGKEVKKTAPPKLREVTHTGWWGGTGYIKLYAVCRPKQHILLLVMILPTGAVGMIRYDMI